MCQSAEENLSRFCYPLPPEIPLSDASVLFVVGPTAVGKSALALHLAQRFDGEIVSADSRQVYRFMDIGTAKPSAQDQARVRHHLIDVLDPDEQFNLAAFLDMAPRAIGDIQGRGKIPIVTGGTGQYVWALLEGWQVPHVPPNNQLRQELAEVAKSEGADALHGRLRDVDQDAASRIEPRNLRRVIRALEIYHTTHLSPSTVRRKARTPYSSLIIGLTTSREELYNRIDRRVEKMLETGLVEEVRELIRRGYPSDLSCMSSMGYKEIALYLAGELTLEKASQRIKYGTHHFARHQYAWFRPGDPRIRWLKISPEVNLQAESMVERVLRRGLGCGKMASTSEEKVQ